MGSQLAYPQAGMWTKKSIIHSQRFSQSKPLTLNPETKNNIQVAANVLFSVILQQ